MLCAAVSCSLLQRVALRCSAVRCGAVRCSVLQCVAVHCSALQRVCTYLLILSGVLPEGCLVIEPPMGWLRLVGILKLYVSLENLGLFYRALLQKRPMILRSLLAEATTCQHTDDV